MSDVIVSTTESTTDVTTTNDVTTVAITNTVVEISQATAGLQGVPGSNSDPIYIFVRNSTGAQLNKGTIVYVSGANGTHVQVTPASASSDATSARTVGWLAEDIANNASGLCQIEGYLEGVNTQAFDEGDQLYLSTTAGGFTATKPQAPTHLVYVGVVAKKSAGNGKVFVKVQNGYELDELHNVQIISVADKNLIQYDSASSLWVNVAATAITAGSAITAGTASFASSASTANTAGTAFYSSTSGSAITITGSITKSQVSDFTSGTVASAGTAQQAGTAVTISGSITRSQVSDFTSGTVASAGTAQTAGTASFADQAGTATYSTTSGSAVTITGSITKSQVSDFTSGTVTTISGSITRSQVSDYASGTVANISGTVTQAQVSGLGTALAGKAGLADNNTFTGTNTFSNFTTFQAASDAIPVRIFGANGQSADLFSVNDYLTNTQFEILSDGRAQSLKGIIATVSGTASIPLVVRGTAGQSANLTEWTNPAGSTVIARVDKNGAVSANYFGPSGSGLLGYLDWTTSSPLFQTGGTAVVGLRVRGASGQSANLQSWQLSDATETTRVRPGGQIGIGSLITGTTFAVNTDTVGGASSVGAVIRGASGQSADLLQIQDSSANNNLSVSSTYGLVGRNAGTVSFALSSQNGLGAFYLQNAAQVGMTVRGASGQSANLQEWQNSGGTVLTRISPTGQLASGTNAAIGQTSINTSTMLQITSTGTATVGAVVRGAASQSANLLELQDSSASTVVAVNPFGAASFGTNSILGRLTVSTGSSGTIGQVIRGVASQSANLQEWQTSSGSTAARVDSGGIVYGTQVRGLSSLVLLTEASGGGLVTMARATATPSSPGANTARLYFRDGTNAGTLKLVVRAGAAGAETTILDNIPQS